MFFDMGWFDSRWLFCLHVFLRVSAFDVLTQDPSRGVREGPRSIPNPLNKSKGYFRDAVFHIFVIPFVPQPGLPWGSYSQEEISVSMSRASGSPRMGAPVPPAPGPQVPQA